MKIDFGHFKAQLFSYSGQLIFINAARTILIKLGENVVDVNAGCVDEFLELCAYFFWRASCSHSVNLFLDRHCIQELGKHSMHPSRVLLKLLWQQLHLHHCLKFTSVPRFRSRERNHHFESLFLKSRDVHPS